ncbi:betaine/proline/choline family ABC transporter ATP-binding protein [Alkalibaculum sp. M08DMB]|uniref:Quaternary amine transport ATP-binding protein n=1 Tax=Alkalibaculum sporogenes TaxID=2655001 RepID=A0A6A7K548_9FIRM|nr:ABC transporter ATP-binding protein [Alkalibaculum sporogenes]MPW24589.1 betaine/proline/choline family ABC transporter ATP-binding protein [Alkalibaculum sporogenes]
MIEYKNIHKEYQGVSVINNINFKINNGEFVVLIGPSGCGKTTTLKMLNRLIKIDSGEIYIDNKNIMEVDIENLRRNIGYVIQQIGLFPNMTIEENICVVPKLLKWDKDKCNNRVHELLSMVSMPYEQYAKKYPKELSGGQQQRIGVLRAIAAKPPIILMDEPFGALDPITRDILQDEVKDLQKKLNLTVIFVTHDMDEAIKLADTIIFMDKGDILQIASPEEMLRAPANEIISEFMGKRGNFLDAENMACSDLMRTPVFTIKDDKKTLECIEIMKKRQIDSLIVVDKAGIFQGVVTIESIRSKGKAGEKINSLISKDFPTVLQDDVGKTAFDLLMDKKYDYVIVLTRDNSVVGIITKSSLAKALASVVWGEM